MPAYLLTKNCQVREEGVVSSVCMEYLGCALWRRWILSLKNKVGRYSSTRFSVPLRYMLS